MKRLTVFLNRSNVVWLFIVLLGLIFLPNVLFIFRNIQFDNEMINVLDNIGLIPSLILTVIVLPLWETIVFQTTIISICQTIIKNKTKQFVYALLISSLLFALSHSYPLAAARILSCYCIN
ncbi:CPBP family glutamic-type intramembrane protease [Marinifilum sp. RC60d5]|uniref:CPBP family glutamic-type intramembrane protease n=1 Tax=Marinifilum sp. RC60d5 TaxID=3458414 RepID=UPI0040362134